MQLIVDALQSIAIIFLARSVGNMATTYQKDKKTGRPEQETQPPEE